MSRFFSPKYLAYRRLADGGRIDEDRPCRSCGYNLRGLNYGRNCPECGELISLTEPMFDVLIACAEDERGRWQTGLGLAATCILVALVSRVFHFLVALFGASGVSTAIYVGITALNAVVWVVAVWLVTPPTLDARKRGMRLVRMAARWLAILWLVGYAFLIARYWLTLTGRTNDIAIVVDAGGRLLGGVGVLFVASILGWVAAEAELVLPARRLNAAVWLLAFPTLLLAAVPSTFPWPFIVPFVMVMFFWSWVMTLLFLGVYALYGHVRWAQRHATERVGRDERIATQRRAIERAVESTIRPAPDRPGSSTEDVGMEP